MSMGGAGARGRNHDLSPYLRLPGEGRGPYGAGTGAGPWIPAFAGKPVDRSRASLLPQREKVAAKRPDEGAAPPSPPIPLILAEARTQVFRCSGSSQGLAHTAAALIAPAINLGPRFREDERSERGSAAPFLQEGSNPLISCRPACRTSRVGQGRACGPPLRGRAQARSLSNPDRPAIVSARDEGGGVGDTK